MAKPLDVTIEDKQIYALINKLISKIDRPEPLLRIIGRYIRAETKKMFVGRRPDLGIVRGEKWPKLKKSTIEKKKQLKRKGLAIGTHRPLIEKGNLKKDLLSKKAIKVTNKGLTYGTDRKSSKGFAYPAAHQTGTKRMPQRKFLFLTTVDLHQIAIVTRDWLKGIKTRKI